MKKAIIITLILLPLYFSATRLQATHIRAGEIIAERISSQTLKYRFTIIAYTDTEGQNPPILFGTSGVLDFGDGRKDTLAPEMFKRTLVEKGIARNEYQVEHTFQAPATYVISYKENNRNDEVLNIPNSVEIAFYVETVLVIDPFVGLNNTPTLLIPPIDKAVTGVKYMHNPGAYDIDGDSLSYKVVINKRDEDIPIEKYMYPNDPFLYEGLDYEKANQEGNRKPTYSIDPITGDLVWDAPGQCGEYNVAFIVEEWRKFEGKWEKLGYVTRDMQIIVECSENTPPELFIPKDTCVVAGTLLEVEVTAIDEELHDVIIEPFGAPFELNTTPAVFMPDPPVFQPTDGDSARLYFSWKTNCSLVRAKPYTVQFKAKDDPKGTAPSLSTFESWNITVVGPAPQGLQASVSSSNSIDLSWDNYTCQEAELMQIWRRVGPYDFEPTNCMTGVPQEANYELIAEVPIIETSYTDEYNLSSGSNYCYRLVAKFPSKLGGESYASNESCAVIETSAPIITQVDVLSTSETAGQIRVGWAHPLKMDSALFPPPYSYEVLKEKEGDEGKVVLESLGKTQDTLWLDDQLNTFEKMHRYKVAVYDKNNHAVDTSVSASSVWLNLKSGLKTIGLSWYAHVPWSIQSMDHPWHYIYRDHVDPGDPTKMVLIDSVNVIDQGLTYLDEGKVGEAFSEEKLYCYKVLTKGSYGYEKIKAPLLNNSQIGCAQPNDTVAPCAPVTFSVQTLNASTCEEFLALNSCRPEELAYVLSWSPDIEGSCENDISSYKVLYSSTGQEEDYDTIATVFDNAYEFRNTESYAGCFKVIAVDRSGNLSEASEEICIENCTYYELPNVFTPNGDGINDTFRAFNCPLFVESVKLRIFNRWGRSVYRFESGEENSIYIDWDGRADNGRLVSSGIYFYEATVTFKTLYPYNSEQVFKGWVDIKY